MAGLTGSLPPAYTSLTSQAAVPQADLYVICIRSVQHP